MATGTLPARSCSVKVRPRVMRMPNVLKYSGVTMLNPAPGRWPGSFTGLPTIVNGIPKLVPLTGMPVDTDAETTPGSACTRARSCS